MDAGTVSPILLLGVVAGYFAVLMLVSYLTAGRADSEAFFKAGKSSPWYLVAWGMIGASLSGVTFVSIPGVVGAGGHNQALSYMQVVLGYLLGYAVIALVLLPLYYRLGLTSIYGYLGRRLGLRSYYTGAAFFQVSRVLGASCRLYIVAIVLDTFVLGPLGVPVWVTIAVTLLLIYLYTYRGGIQTVVYTDTLQTLAMLTAVAIAVVAISNELGAGIADVPRLVINSGLDQTFFFGGGWADENNFWKQFFSGALITIVMTGLDQDMMQKNLTCKNLGEAQKNVSSLAILLVPINLLFLCLGILLYLYLGQEGIAIPERADQVFPTVALQSLPAAAGIAFIVGLIAAAYSSADSALTSLTTSFCVDFLGFERSAPEVANTVSLSDAPGSGNAAFAKTPQQLQRTRGLVHAGFAVVLFVVVLLIYVYSDDSIINTLFWLAGLTYGPLLGMFAFGLFTNRVVKDWAVPLICVVAPLLTYVIDRFSAELLGGFQFGFTLLALNGLLTLLGMVIMSTRRTGKLANV